MSDLMGKFSTVEAVANYGMFGLVLIFIIFSLLVFIRYGQGKDVINDVKIGGGVLVAYLVMLRLIVGSMVHDMLVE